MSGGKDSVTFEQSARTPCVDLRATFGKRFKYATDPALATERPDFRAQEAAWLTRIPCRYGYLFPHGQRQIAAYTNHRRLFDRLQALPGATVQQRGDQELVVTIDVDEIEAAADLLQARRPAQLSPAAQERQRESGRRLAEAYPLAKKRGKPGQESTNGSGDAQTAGERP